MRYRMHTRRGQVIIMVTLALMAMFGIMGLAVDLAWSFFVRKAAQAAADSAALAAVQAAFVSPSLTCGAVACSTPVECPGATLNLTNGCQYAQSNGFTTAGNQTVTLEADMGANRLPANVPYLTVEYWATARVREDIPQLFSSVLGNVMGTSGARATAAIVNAQYQAALILLNRQRDCLAWAGPNSKDCGVNLWASGNSYLRAQAGIMMASTRHGDPPVEDRDVTHYAGELGGTARVEADYTGIRTEGTANVAQTDPAWYQPWQNGVPETDFFKDPMRSLNGQPPPPPATGANFAVADCTIQGGTDAANVLRLSPGKYYSVAGLGGCRDGDPIQVTGYVEFLPDSTGFANYTFFGGLKTVTSTNITFNPGRYVIAGVRPNNNSAGSLFDASSGQVTLTDKTPLLAGASQPNTDAGEIFIFTNADYPGLDTSGVPSSVLTGLDFGTSGFQAGNNNQVTINLHGLNRSAPELPPDLRTFFANDINTIFQPVLLWQDQRNSVTRYYNADGTKNMTCITGDVPCVNTLSNLDSPMLSVQASSAVHLYGVIYQPRGAWTELSGGETYSGPLRIITGAIRLIGGADLTMASLGTPMNVRMVALIE